MHSFIEAVDRLWGISDDPLQDDQFDWDYWDEVENRYWRILANTDNSDQAFFIASSHITSPHGFIEVGYSNPMLIPCCGDSHKEQYRGFERIDLSIPYDSQTALVLHCLDIYRWYEEAGFIVPSTCPVEPPFAPLTEIRSLTELIGELIGELPDGDS